MQFDTKIEHSICTVRQITSACVEYTSMLEELWVHVWSTKQQARYQPVTNYIYLPVLGLFNNFNIITLSHKATPSEDFHEIHQAVLDVISVNMASLFQSRKYGAIITTDFQQWNTMLLIFLQRPTLYWTTAPVTYKLVWPVNWLSRRSMSLYARK